MSVLFAGQDWMGEEERKKKNEVLSQMPFTILILL